MTVVSSVYIDSSLIPEYFSKIGNVHFDNGYFITIIGTSYKEIRLIAFSKSLEVVGVENLCFDGAYFSASIHTLDANRTLIHVAKTEIDSSNSGKSYYQGYSSFWYMLSFSDSQITLIQVKHVKNANICQIISKEYYGYKIWICLKVVPNTDEIGEYQSRHKNFIGYSYNWEIPEFNFFQTSYKSIDISFDFSLKGDIIHLFAATNFNKILSHVKIDIKNQVLVESDFQPKFGRKYDEIDTINLFGENADILLWNTRNQESNKADRSIFFSLVNVENFSLKQSRFIESKDLDSFIISENSEEIFSLASCYGASETTLSFTKMNKKSHLIETVELKNKIQPISTIDSKSKVFLTVVFGNKTQLYKVTW